MTRQRNILKKGYIHLLGRQKLERKFEVIQHLRSDLGFEVREVCAVLEVTTSGFYAHRHKGQRARRREDQALSQAMHQASDQSGAAHGSLRLVRALQKLGLRTSKT